MDFQPSYKEFALIFKALSDETRLRVIDMLSCREMSACDILSNFTLSQSTLSYHMKILIESGVVNARHEGLWTKYRINDETFTKLMDFLPELYMLTEVHLRADQVLQGGSTGSTGGRKRYIWKLKDAPMSGAFFYEK